MPARLTSDLLELGGALGVGAALEAYANGKGIDNPAPFIVDIVAAATGVLLATQLDGTLADLGSGIAGGSMGHAGARLYRYLTMPAVTPGPAVKSVETLSAPSALVGSPGIGAVSPAAVPAAVLEI